RSDPFSRHISVAERNRRLQQAFAQAGERLLKCPEATGTDLTASPPSNDDLSSLRAQWLQMKPKVGRLNRPEEKNLFDSAMNLVLQIEQQAEKNCSPASDTDKALLLLAKGRSGVEQ
ncbi:MAG: hypothetical protein QOD84_2838, partial [Acidobacteriaceae bacterium]